MAGKIFVVLSGLSDVNGELRRLGDVVEESDLVEGPKDPKLERYLKLNAIREATADEAKLNRVEGLEFSPVPVLGQVDRTASQVDEVKPEKPAVGKGKNQTPKDGE